MARHFSEYDGLIAKRIRARRLQLGMSQETLGEAIGVTFQQVQKYEKGTNRVSAGRLIEIAEALEVNPEFFIKSIGDGTKAIVEQERAINFLQTRDGIELTEAMAKAKPAIRKAALRFLIDVMAA